MDEPKENFFYKSDSYTEEQLDDFLFQSNLIEGVADEGSLVDAHTAWEYLVRQIKMKPEVVTTVHQLLMQGQSIERKYKGHYRDCPVWVGRNEKLPHTMIKDLVREWCDRMNEHEREHDEDELHVLYETIHPFIDGNGRTGRLFYNWLRVQRGEPIHIFWEDEKYEYYKLFK